MYVSRFADVFQRREFLAQDRTFNQAVISRSGLLKLEWAPAHLVTLSLPKNSIYEILPDALSACADSLSSLDLSDNFLGEVPDLSSMQGLRWLNLQHNQLVELPAGVAATNLSTLLLADNNIRTISINLLPSSLETLDLESNQILSLEGHPFPSATKQLNLGNNLLRHLPHSFHRLHSLQQLTLSNNGFHDMPSRWKLPSSLQLLDVSRGALHQLRGPCLGLDNASCHHLQTLHLDFNFISAVGEDTFDGMRLTKLFLNANRLMQLPPGLFKGTLASQYCVIPSRPVLAAAPLNSFGERRLWGQPLGEVNFLSKSGFPRFARLFGVSFALGLEVFFEPLDATLPYMSPTAV